VATKDELLGALVVVGITYDDTDGETWLHQVAGIVERVDDVIEVREAAGTLFSLPPVPEAFEPADSGIYTLRATGEQVVDPAFTAMFTVAPREASAESDESTSR
jgi:hypothetical protein